MTFQLVPPFSDVQAGQNVALVAESGAGKSTVWQHAVRCSEVFVYCGIFERGD